jgi:surface antigen
VRLLGFLVASALVALGVPMAPAQADYVTICTGYVGCKDAGYSNDGYKSTSGTSYWRMYTGHNCTNYVAYRMVRAGLPNTRPWTGGGNAEEWGHEMSSITDLTPMVGAVAWWDEGVKPAGSSGHVAYVERVISSSEIWISEDSWGGDFHWRRVTKSGTGWPSGFIHFRDVALRNKTVPTVSGTAEVGQTLTATPGSWSPATTAVTYQWLADGVPVSTATAPTFVLGPGRVGQQITVAVTAREPGYAASSATSLATAAVAPGTMTAAEKPAIAGDAEVGSLLTATEGTWTPDARTRTIQWLSDGKPLAGATDWTLALEPEHAGTVITAAVTASRKGYEPSTVSSEPTESVLGGEVTLTTPYELAGVARLGQELRVVNGGYEPTTATAGYTWFRNGTAVAGATGPSYALGEGDVGARMSVLVDVTNPGYKPASQTIGAATRVHTVPQLDVTSVGGRLRATVTVAIGAPGVAVPLGKITVQVGTHSRTVRLREGERSVVLRDLRAGDRRVVVRYLGRGLVDAGVYRGSVLVGRR